MKNFSTPELLSRRTLAVIALALLLVITAGCSTIRLSYNQGDTLLYWWLDSYVDFEGRQRDLVKRDINNLFQWHRQTQLKDYAALLETFQRQLAGNPTQADLVHAYRELRLRGERLAMHAVPEMTTLALSITPEQIGNIERKFAAKNEEYRRKFLSGDTEKRQRARYKASMKQFEQWFGDFNSEQEAVMRRASDARPLDHHIRLEERQYRQRRILNLLRKVQQEKLNREQTSAQLQAMLREFLGRMESPERKAFYDAYLDHTTRFILTGIRTATPAQKQHAQQRIAGWIQDFHALAAGK